MGQGTAGKDVQVVKLRKELPGLHLEMYADRDAGEVLMQSNFVDGGGGFMFRDSKRFHAAELVHLDDVLNFLWEAVEALTPRRRLDLARLDPPSPAPVEEE